MGLVQRAILTDSRFSGGLVLNSTAIQQKASSSWLSRGTPGVHAGEEAALPGQPWCPLAVPRCTF
jgi:hypothetical protein